MAKNKIVRWRDAGNGQFLTPNEAQRRPDNQVVKETFPKPPAKKKK